MQKVCIASSCREAGGLACTEVLSRWLCKKESHPKAFNVSEWHAVACSEHSASSKTSIAQW